MPKIELLTSSGDWVQKLQSLFDRFWMGSYCSKCAYQKQCPDPIGVD